ncbi:MAG: hypothetical protein ACI9ES_002040, partial [Oceanospirillaceae bacterium]
AKQRTELTVLTANIDTFNFRNCGNSRSNKCNIFSS